MIGAIEAKVEGLDSKLHAILSLLQIVSIDAKKGDKVQQDALLNWY